MVPFGRVQRRIEFAAAAKSGSQDILKHRNKLRAFMELKMATYFEKKCSKYRIGEKVK